MNSRAVAVLILAFCLASGSPPGRCAPAKPAVRKPPAVNLTGAYNAYLNRLRSKVLNYWDFPEGKNHVVLQTSVSADGTASEFTLNSTPRNETAERAASAALSQAQPFEPLPAGSPPAAKITLTFDSSSDAHGDSNSSLGARLDPIAITAPPAVPAQVDAAQTDAPSETPPAQAEQPAN